MDTEVKSQARSQADVVAAASAELLSHRRKAALDQVVELSAHTVRGRVMVVNGEGRVIADSAPGNSTVGTSYRSRPEVATALTGSSYQDTRSSQTLGTELLATAVPILHGGRTRSSRGRPGLTTARTVGAVRVTQSVDAVNSAVRRAIVGLGVLSVIVLGLGLIAGALIAQQIARPIHRLGIAARRVADGDLDARAPVEGSSEQRSLARSFNEMTVRVSRLLKMQRDFVADASHQLRTPLTGLRLQLEELRETTPDDDPRAKRLEAGMSEVDRLSQMVDELLVLSRAGEHEQPGTQVDLARTADRALERWQKAASDAGVELVRKRRDGPTSVWCTAADLDRALDALVENAIRYSPQASPVEIVNGRRLIEIADRGPGLEPGEEEAVFERFHRGRAGRQGVKGTGLGLPIARELVEQWGGSVTIANRDGRGARAVINWPQSHVPKDETGERS